MTFVIFSNLILMLLCVAVIVQTLRMAKGIRDIRSSSLNESVTQLDRATGQARAVLTELKALLATDATAQSRAIADGEALRDELSLMVGIGNAVAERIMEAATAQNEAKASQPAKSKTPGRRQGARKPRRPRAASEQRKEPAAAVLAVSVAADTPVVGHA